MKGVQPADLGEVRAHSDQRIPLRNLSVFFRQMATLLSAGVPVDKALLTQHDSGEPKLDIIAQELHGLVISGHLLSSALGRYPTAFSPINQGLVKVGEETGRFTDVFEKLADVNEQALRLRKSLISGLTYPAVLAVIMTAVCLLGGGIICSQDSAIFNLAGKEPPLPTLALMTVFRLLTSPSFWLLVTVLLFSLVEFVRRFRKSRVGYFDRLLLRLPAVGRLTQKLAAARVSLVLATGLKVGMPLTQGLALSETVTGNRELSRQLGEVRNCVKEGSTLTEGFAQSQLFTPLELSLLEVGEESATLDTMFERIAEALEEDVVTYLKLLVDALEPLLLVFAGAVALFVAVGALAPMFNLLKVV